MSRPKGHRDAGYETKRRELLRRMSVRMMRREDGSMSLRDLSAAAGVAIPTLRHYFGARHDVVDAILEEALRIGRPGLDAQRTPEAPFAESIRAYVTSLLSALVRPREVRLGDVVAVSLAEGLLDPRVASSALRHIIDPTVDALRERLEAHQARGEMRPCDARLAALHLISPILLGVLHQDQLHGRESAPLDLETSAGELADAFVRAYAAVPTAAARPQAGPRALDHAAAG